MSSKQFFDQVSEDWDEMRPRFYSESVREKAFAIAGLAEGKLAADVGAGTGFISEGLLLKGLNVIAVDQSEAMLSRMRNKLARFREVEYRHGEAEQLPLEDDVVDYVFANMYLHHVDSPGVAIKEMARILKPEGRLTITDVYAHSFEFLKREHHDRWLGFEKEDVEGWFLAAGLKDISVQNISEECRVLSIESGEEALMSIFAATGEK